MYWPVYEYTGFVTRQFTGATPFPSSRFVSTATITVPSSNVCIGPDALIGAARSAGRTSLAGGFVERDGCCGGAVGAVSLCADVDAPPVARTTAWSISSNEASRGRV